MHVFEGLYATASLKDKSAGNGENMIWGGSPKGDNVTFFYRFFCIGASLRNNFENMVIAATLPLLFSNWELFKSSLFQLIDELGPPLLEKKLSR